MTLYYILFFVIGCLIIFYIFLNLFNRENRAVGKSIKRKYCPLCGSELQLGEALQGEINKNSKPTKIYIKGCRQCYPAYDFKTKKTEVINSENIAY
jgi:RNase P subunit RPR2